MIRFNNGMIATSKGFNIWTPFGDLVFEDGKCNNQRKILNDLLESSYKNKELVYIDGFRGMGFTEALINFAKINNLPLIVQTDNIATSLKRKYEYEYIYGSYNLKDINLQDGISLIDVNIATKDLPKEFTYIGFTNIIGNCMINKIDEDKMSPKELLINELYCLGKKIKKHNEENKDVGTYKNLILAYKEVLNLLINMNIEIDELETGSNKEYLYYDWTRGETLEDSIISIYYKGKRHCISFKCGYKAIASYIKDLIRNENNVTIIGDCHGIGYGIKDNLEQQGLKIEELKATKTLKISDDK